MNIGNKKLILILLPVVAFITMMFKFESLSASGCELLIYLPLFFGVVSFIFCRNLKLIGKKISFSLIYLLYFMRLVIIPVITCFVNINSLNIDAFTNNAFKTIVMLIIEFFFVMLTSYCFFSKKRCDDKSMDISAYKEKVVFNKSYKYMIFILVVLFILIIMAFPSLKYYFKFLFETNSLESTIKQYENSLNITNTVPSLLYMLFKYLFFVIYFFVPFLIIMRIYGAKLNDNKKIKYSLVVILITVCITTTDDKAISIFVSLSLIVILTILYKDLMKRYLKMLIPVSVCAVFYALFAKNSNTILDSAVLDTLSSYFSGPFYVAYVFKMGDGVNINSFLLDIPASMSFIMYFFKDVNTSNELFNYCIYNNNLIVNKIIPMVSQSCYYFGILLSPLLSVIFTLLSFTTEEKYSISNNYIYKYILIYLCILFSSSLIIYNFSIIITNLSGIGLFLLLMYMSSKIKFN